MLIGCSRTIGNIYLTLYLLPLIAAWQLSYFLQKLLGFFLGKKLWRWYRIGNKIKFRKLKLPSHKSVSRFLSSTRYYIYPKGFQSFNIVIYGLSVCWYSVLCQLFLYFVCVKWMFLIGLLIQNFQQIQQLQLLISGSWLFVHSIFLPCVFLSASIIPHLMSKSMDIGKYFEFLSPIQRISFFNYVLFVNISFES